MNPHEIQTLISAVQSIATVLSGLGVPGLIALALSAPALVLVTMLVLDYLRAVRTEKMIHAFRNDTGKLLETYRTDTASIVRDLGREHDEAVEFYRSNIDLVRAYNRMADSFQSIVVNNTRAMERLVTIVEERRIGGNRKYDP